MSVWQDEIKLLSDAWLRRASLRFRWWELEDLGGWPPFWDYAINPPNPPEQPRLDAARRPWPSEWNRRPHP